MAISKLFISNRGEIAVRIIHAAKKKGIRTVQAYSEADASMLAVKIADEAICIGPASASESYLNIDKIIEAALSSGSDAIHPGYGFLSENSEFARKIEDAGLIFVGPKAETIQQMGDKVAARNVAIAADVPVVPGSIGRIDSVENAIEVANKVGFPVLIKAAAGGGGRGIRIVHNEQELRTQAPEASVEAKAAFGDGGLYIEKVIEDPRHIEVQILGDGIDVIHCFERECSIQRRRQKVWEEAGAFGISDNTLNKMYSSAVALARAVNYRGAGTIEYIYDSKTDEFFFIEMNTRIQVEHPVTEMITGIDLVGEMLAIAGGSKLSLTQKEVNRKGHAIEVRINAEDPTMQFMPFPGKVNSIKTPDSEGVRFDHFLYEGYQIPPFYDSLLGKLIVHAESRSQAIKKMGEALESLELNGLKTTIPLHKALVKSDDVSAGYVHTRWLEPWLESNALI